MVVSPRGLLQIIIGLDFFFLVSIVDSMGSQNPEDWEFSLAHLSDDPIQLFQPSTLRRRVRDETETSERRVQPRSDLDPQQLPLTSLKILQLDVRALVIILEAEAMLIGGHHVIFERCFQNTNEGQMMNRMICNPKHRFLSLFSHNPLPVILPLLFRIGSHSYKHSE
jgi:hypothetical protein